LRPISGTILVVTAIALVYGLFFNKVKIKYV